MKILAYLSRVIFCSISNVIAGWKWSTTNKAEAIQINLAGTLAVRTVPSRGNRRKLQKADTKF